MSRRAAFVVVLLALSALVALAHAQLPARFVAPHRVRAARAVLAPALRARLASDAAAAAPTTGDALVAFALAHTAAQLHFGLAHRTSLHFDIAEREGNCVEYAELFAAILGRTRGALDVRAWVVRSDALVLGRAIPDPAWRDHDWALVRVREGGVTSLRYLDPTLFDAGLSPDVSASIDGTVTPPRHH